MTIDYLANHRDLVPELARCSFNEWRSIHEQRGMTLEDVAHTFHQRAHSDRIPLALIALDGRKLIGTGSLKLNDSDLHPELNPWLGGLFVVPEYRHQGVASALITRLLEETRRLQISVLYLWTPSAEALYAKFGWEVIEKSNFYGYAASLMKLLL
jgi:GNAT superfamily N-acetyltransferase